MKKNFFRLISIALILLLSGCPADQDKSFEPITTSEASVQKQIKKSLDSNALNIEMNKTKEELLVANKNLEAQSAIVSKQFKEINNKNGQIKTITEKQLIKSTENKNLQKLNQSLSNNLEDKNKLIKELNKKKIDLEEKLKLFHQNSQKLDSDNLKEKNKYIKDLLTESQELKKLNKQINLEVKILNEKIIELEKNPPKKLHD